MHNWKTEYYHKSSQETLQREQGRQRCKLKRYIEVLDKCSEDVTREKVERSPNDLFTTSHQECVTIHECVLFTLCKQKHPKNK